MKLREKLEAIRKVLDVDIADADILMQQNKLLELTRLMGLSAECKAEAQRELHLKELQVFPTLSGSANIIMAQLKGHCASEIENLVYADRLNAALTHSIDAIRSVISLYKTELENSVKG